MSDVILLIIAVLSIWTLYCILSSFYYFIVFLKRTKEYRAKYNKYPVAPAKDDNEEFFEINRFQEKHKKYGQRGMLLVVSCLLLSFIIIALDHFS